MNIDPVSITIGWREVVIGLIAIVAVYMLVVLLRMRRLRGKAAIPAGAAPAPTPDATQAGPENAEDGDMPSRESEVGWKAAQSTMAQEAFMRGVEGELTQLRDEVDALRGELAALRDEIRQEVGHMRANQTVSPIYTDAMQMAQLGHDAATIAERCGIARAEAELVVALVKSQNN